jgi:hypothetical protein
MLVDSIINKLILDIEEIEKNIVLILSSEHSSSEIVDLVDVYIKEIRNKVEDFVSCTYILFKEYESKNIQEVQGNNIICALISLLLLKSYLKIGLLGNKATLIRATIFNSLNNLDEGVLNKISNMIDILLLGK